MNDDFLTEDGTAIVPTLRGLLGRNDGRVKRPFAGRGRQFTKSHGQQRDKRKAKIAAQARRRNR